jgi:uncharacterized protein (TIGR02453 family)
MPIPRAYFAFLEDLAAHNDRAWFKAHEAAFRTDVRAPFLALLADVAPGIGRVCPHVRCDPAPSGGSTLRIHRDVRFSRDKSPYKTHMAALLLHRDRPKGAGMMGLYLRLGPDEMLLGAVVHAPDAASLARIRRAFAEGGRRWARVSEGMLGEQLKRVPPGFDPGHPFADDLRRKEFHRNLSYTRREVLDPGFPRTVVAAARKLEPLLAFLAGPLGLAW